MNQTAAHLKTILAALRNDVVPELSSDMARHRAELIDFILSRLVAQMSEPDAWREEYREKVERAFGQMQIAQFCPPSDADESSKHSGRQVTLALKTILADVIERQGAAGIPRAALDMLVRDIAHAEAEHRDRFESLVQSESRTASAAQVEHVVDRLTVESVSAYLRTRFPDSPHIRAKTVTPIPGGRSKGTTLLALEGQDPFPRDVVLRQDINAQVGGLSVTYEYPLLVELWRAGLEIPQPLWLEESENELGGPFCAFARSQGRPGGTLFRMDAPAEVARDAAKFFGRLHSLDIDASGLRGKLWFGMSQTPVRDLLDFNYAKWKASEIEPSLLIETSFLWLYDHLDAVDPKSALVHGDGSYHNMLVHGGRLSAVLDWEFAHAGDAAEDLLGSEHFTTQVLPWQEFMRIYCDNGGGEISRQRFQFFALWRSLRFAIATAAAGHVFATGVNTDLRVAAIGYNTYPRLLQDVARQLAAMD